MPSPSSEEVGGRSPAATSSGNHSLGDFYPQVIPCHRVKGTLRASPLSLFSAKLTTRSTEAGHSGWEAAVRAEGSLAELGGGRARTELGQHVPSDSGRALGKGCLILPASPTLGPERTAPQGPALYTDKECLRLACGHLLQDTGLSRARTSLCPLGPLLGLWGKGGPPPSPVSFLQILNSQGPKSRPKRTSIKMCLKRTFSTPAGPLPAPTLGFWADFWKQTCHQLPRAEQLPEDLGGCQAEQEPQVPFAESFRSASRNPRR